MGLFARQLRGISKRSVVASRRSRESRRFSRQPRAPKSPRKPRFSVSASISRARAWPRAGSGLRHDVPGRARRGDEDGVDSAPVSEVRRDPRNARGPGVTQRAPPTRTIAPAAASSASAAASRRARASRPEARIESLDGPGGATDRDALRAKRDETPTDIVSGRSLPHPSNSTHVSLKTTGQAAKSRLRDAGITHLTPVQERVLRAIIVDRLDVLVQAPTGSGKTLAYLLPWRTRSKRRGRRRRGALPGVRGSRARFRASCPRASSPRRCSSTPRSTSLAPGFPACCAAAARTSGRKYPVSRTARAW